MKLQDYINYYIGCKMIRSSHWQPQNEPYVLDYKNIAEAIEFDDRPVLRRMEDMTEKDWGTVTKSTKSVSDYIDRDSLKDSFINGGFDDRYHWTVVNKSLIALRKLGVDVDGLIPAGLAIDAKTLKS